jgi:hypothetical protein
LSPDARALASCIKPAEARPLYSRGVTIDDLLREVAIRVLRSAETARADVPPFRCERQFYAAALAVVNHTSKSAPFY